MVVGHHVEAVEIELEEAGRIDGANRWQVFRHVVLPLTRPGLTVALLLSFIFSWNNFVFGIVLAGRTTRTLPVAVYNSLTFEQVSWGPLSAAALVVVVPVLVHQEVGPFEALRRSANLLRRTWGENAIGNVGIGLAFGLISFAIVVVGALVAFVAAQLSAALAVVVVVLFVIGLLMLGVYQAALSGIYSAALYRYAMEGEAPPAFRALQLESAFAAK